MEYLATNDKITINIEVTNTPSITLDEIQIAHRDTSVVQYIAGNHRWNLLETTSDVTSLIDTGIMFTMKSAEWVIENCRVCADRKTIYYSHATHKFK